MSRINYQKLYTYFRKEECLTACETLRNIWRVGNLPKEYKMLVYKILENKLPDIANFSVEGVTLKSLCKEEDMKKVQAVFFLDWLRREPANARSYMASKRWRTPQEISDDDREFLMNALKRAKEKTGTDVPSVLVPEDKSGNDIDVETESDQVGVMTTNTVVEHAEIKQEELDEMVKDAENAVKDATNK